MPAEFTIWTECVPSFGPLSVFVVTISCNGMKRELKSKAFNARKTSEAAQAWLEFMALTGNIIITSVMPPAMLARFAPTTGGGMRLLDPPQ